jgi:hypothetical protein
MCQTVALMLGFVRPAVDAQDGRSGCLTGSVYVLQSLVRVTA